MASSTKNRGEPRARSAPEDPRLGTYRKKRRFARTPEPAGAATPAPGRARERLQYVVQKHAASRLHYDFRLELGGVLLSWAVPKGPSVSPSEKRLAVRTEDHPLAYAAFEGRIPKGEYGAGRVVIWDRGHWTPEGDPRAGLRKGHLVFALDGEKLQGRWHLVRTHDRDSKKEQWLLFKGHDEAAAASDEKSDEKAPGGRHSVVDLVRRLPVDFELTNLEKVLYPEQGLRKAELIAYVASVAEWILPHLSNRPLTLVRCPDGREGQCFYQKHATAGVPKAVGRIRIEEEGGAAKTYMTVKDMQGLVALAQIGALELHAWVCHADAVERPDQLIIDIDPDVGLGWERAVEAALDLRTRLAALDLESFVKTTGGKGLHVVAPVVRRLSWDEHKAFARALVGQMAAAAPRRYTTNARKAERKGRLFLDYLRNGRGATAVAPYSPRAREGATVATPITWKELEAGIDPQAFTVQSVPKRLARVGRDPWAGHLALRQSISAAARRRLGV